MFTTLCLLRFSITRLWDRSSLTELFERIPRVQRHLPLVAFSAGSQDHRPPQKAFSHVLRNPWDPAYRRCLFPCPFCEPFAYWWKVFQALDLQHFMSPRTSCGILWAQQDLVLESHFKPSWCMQISASGLVMLMQAYRAAICLFLHECTSLKELAEVALQHCSVDASS